ncbi:molybdopterin converting factor subunit 1 [Marinobacterium arenosum]|uniref:molybdopterin converting factor subunit 1 n=1 Tax=Marinobacterium arenosum TaxID=2862496 RepID=UPI001C94AD25|nr:molybdopterin converting factor subunit 1 [Marinobacterium arenosum]MBY4676832.1 molybdopterin converting factor subunit 1 [Marinobacterium arenosum]
MLTLVYFARIREQLGLDSEQLPLPAGVTTVGQLIEHLVAERGPRWAEVLQAPNLLVAVNQEMVDPQQPLGESDEVAFFPPVTGG